MACRDYQVDFLMIVLINFKLGYAYFSAAPDYNKKMFSKKKKCENNFTALKQKFFKFPHNSSKIFTVSKFS